MPATRPHDAAVNVMATKRMPPGARRGRRCLPRAPGHRSVRITQFASLYIDRWCARTSRKQSWQ